MDSVIKIIEKCVRAEYDKQNNCAMFYLYDGKQVVVSPNTLLEIFCKLMNIRFGVRSNTVNRLFYTYGNSPMYRNNGERLKINDEVLIYGEPYNVVKIIEDYEEEQRLKVVYRGVL